MRTREERIALILKLRDTMSNEEIADIVGLSKTSLENFINRWGLARSRSEREQFLSRRFKGKPRPVLQDHQPVKPKTQTRLCLCGCRQPFVSHYAGERIRPECRGEWSQRV